MGYRLKIDKCKNIYYGSKLFGYGNFEDTESYKWLLSKHYIDEDTIFDYVCDNFIILDTDEIKHFINLYNKDLNNLGKEKDYFINTNEIRKIMKDNEHNFYVISWL